MGDDATLSLLIDRGLISIVRADAGLTVTSSRGRAGDGVPVGAALCDVVPALTGLEQQIKGLRRAPDMRIDITNVAMISREGASERLDFVVLFDDGTNEFLVSIVPSLANNELNLELDRNLRRRLQLETRLAAQAEAISRTNEALARTNADLVNFTRIISHDLKAPMRAIRYATQDIEAAWVAGGDPQSMMQADGLHELRRQSERMARMVTDLLTYSRLDDKAGAVARVDTAAMVDAIVASLPRPAQLSISIEGDWPEVATTGVLLDIVLRNLVDNAIKHHDRAQGLIEVSCRPTDEALELVVRDDGPGIPERYRDTVTRPFVRLQHAETGSGMGLTLVDKIVANAGGRLEIVSPPGGGRGTAVRVAWPLTILAE